MRARGAWIIVVSLVLANSCRALAAQEVAPPHQVTLDASLFAGGLSYARRSSSDKLVGAGAGAGFEINIRLVHGEPWGRKSADIAHLELFERIAPAGRWQYDVGLRAALDLHSAQVSSEAAAGGFLGAYVAPMWGGRRFRIGPRVQAGTYWTSSRPALGISVTPIMARFLF
jgi:hypothetical protein